MVLKLGSIHCSGAAQCGIECRHRHACIYVHIWVIQICACVQADMDFSDGEIQVFYTSLDFSIGEIQTGAKNIDFSNGKI